MLYNTEKKIINLFFILYICLIDFCTVSVHYAICFIYFATMYFYHYVYCIFIRICFIALCNICSPMSENSSVELMFHIYHPTLNKASCILYLV